LKRVLTQILDNRLVLEACHTCIKGETGINRILIQAQQKTTVERAKRVGKSSGYLLENYFGLRDYLLEIVDARLKASLDTSSAGTDSWSWKFNLMAIRDPHRPTVGSYQPLRRVALRCKMW
jgi:hypothetical protein